MKNPLLPCLLALTACASAPPPPPTAEPPKVEAPAPEPVATATAAPAAPAPPEPPKEPLPVFAQGPAAPAPGKLPTLGIVAPGKDQVIPAAKAAGFAVKLKAVGLAAGETLCVAIDRHPCRVVTDLKAPLVLKDVDPSIDEGQHVVSVYARRASGESLKPHGKSAAFAVTSFYVGKRSKPIWEPSMPLVLFTAPEDGPAPEGGVLLDPFLAGAELGAKEYRLHATITGPGLEDGVGTSVETLAPFVLRHARRGEYTVRFSLVQFRAKGLASASATEVSYGAQPAKGPFNEVTRSFRIK